jgi:methylglutaconyl-CoA hydratase
LRAERFGAPQAHAMALVHELCPAPQLDEAVDSLVQTLLANGPQAMRQCKDLVRAVAGQPIGEGLRAETVRRIAEIRASEEGQEGVQAFLQKRRPNWLLPGDAA